MQLLFVFLVVASVFIFKAHAFFDIFKKDGPEKILDNVDVIYT